MLQKYIRWTVLTIVTFSVGCASDTAQKAQAPPTRNETLAQKTPERQVSPLGEIPWLARIKSSPEGAEVYLLENAKAGRLIGKTPLDVAIWTDTIVGRPGQLGYRILTFHLGVLRTKDGFYRGFVIKNGDVQVERYATWSEGLRDEKPAGRGIDIGAGLAYDLRQGKGIMFAPGSFTTDRMIPASYDKEFPPPCISEIMVDFASESKK